jgi:hypothetical protein
LNESKPRRRQRQQSRKLQRRRGGRRKRQPRDGARKKESVLNVRLRQRLHANGVSSRNDSRLPRPQQSRRLLV